MKSQIIDTVPSEAPKGYPYIGKLKPTKYQENGDENLAVLFQKPKTGMVIVGCPSRSIGEYFEGFGEELFERLPANKSIILSN